MLEKLADALNEVVEEFINKRIETQFPETVFHYTDDCGLRGILEHGELWLNDVFSLNDPSEVRHGYEAALDELRAESTRRGVTGANAALARAQANLDWSGLRGIAHMFAACFSASGDDLGQWRAYADDGRGYAIAFDGKMLDEAFLQSDRLHHNTFGVSYNEELLCSIQKRLASVYIDFIEQAAEQGCDVENWHFEHEAFSSYANAAITISLQFKHYAYLDEKEFRLLQIFPADKSPPIKRRIRPYRLVRYREFNWKAHPGLLKGIIVGPANAARSLRFAQDCIQEYSEDKNVQLRVSIIPYQGR